MSSPTDPTASGNPSSMTAAHASLESANPSARPTLCDLPDLALLRVSGLDATAFLQGQFTNDVAKLAIDRWQYSAWCSPKGRMLANFIAIRSGEQDYELVLHASLAQAVRKRLAMFVLRSKVTIADGTPDTTFTGLVGDGALPAVAAGFGSVPEGDGALRIANARWVRLPGPRILIAAERASAPSIRSSLSAATHEGDSTAWALATVRAGVPVISEATTDAFVPQMANWDVLGGVSFQKGCYTGQEIVARTQYLGRLKERLFLAHADVPDVRPGQRIFSAIFADQACGTVVNAAGVDGGVDFLCVLQLSAASSDDLHLDAPSGPALALRSLPYALPAATAPRGRLA